MEVKAGYKQTEVGIIPEEWDVVEAFELDPFITSGSRGWAKYYSDRGALFMRITNLSRKSIYPDLSDQKLVDLPKNETEGLRTTLQDGDILISITADIGIIGYVNVNIPKPAYINQHIACLRLPPKKADSLFQSYYLASHEPQRRFGEITDVGAKTGINLTTIGKLKLLHPPLSEQHAIAEALSDIDGLLGGLDRLIAKQRDLKQAAMQQLLTGHTRLPGFHGEWEVKSIRDLAERKKELFDDGDWIEAEFLTESGVRLVQTGNIGEGQFIDKESKKYISAESFKNLRCKDLQIGDILICRLADPAGRACILPDIGEERVITSVDVTIFRPPASVADRRFLVNVFNAPPWFQAVNERCGGSTRTRISRSELGKMEVTLPPLAEQSAIAEVLSDMDAGLAALEQRRDKTSALKQGMMQELLTGKTRLV